MKMRANIATVVVFFISLLLLNACCDDDLTKKNADTLELDAQSSFLQKLTKQVNDCLSKPAPNAKSTTTTTATTTTGR